MCGTFARLDYSRLLLIAILVATSSCSPRMNKISKALTSPGVSVSASGEVHSPTFPGSFAHGTPHALHFHAPSSSDATWSKIYTWYKADNDTGTGVGPLTSSGMAPNNGDFVKTWQDFSGHSNGMRDAVSPSSPAYPYYVNPPGAAYPTLRFNGSNSALNFDGTGLVGTDYTVFVVAGRANGTQDNLIVGGSEIGADSNLLIGWSSDGSGCGITSGCFLLGQWASSFNSDVHVATPRFPDNLELELWTGVLDSNQGHTVYFNNTFKTVAGSPVSVPVAQNNYKNKLSSYVGAMIGHSTASDHYHASSLMGDIAEIIIYTSALGDTDRQAVQNYLADKYNISQMPISDLVPSMYAWYKADSASLSSQSDGAAISTWQDDGPSQRNAVAPVTSAYQPVLHKNVVNNLPTLRFDGAHQKFNFDGSGLALKTYTVFSVAARNSTSTGNFMLGGSGLTTNSNLILGWYPDGSGYCHAPGPFGSYLPCFLSGQYGNDIDYLLGPYSQTKTFELWEGMLSAGGHFLGRNGFSTEAISSYVNYQRFNNQPLASYQGATIGALPTGRYAGDKPSYFNGDISELIFFDRDLSSQERFSVDQYLSAKYGPFPGLAPNNLYLSGPKTVATNACLAYTVQTTDAYLNPLPVGSGLAITLSATSPSSTAILSQAQLYSDSGCGTAITSITIPANTSVATFYMMDSAAEVTSVNGQAPQNSLTIPGYYTVTVYDPAAPTPTPGPGGGSGGNPIGILAPISLSYSNSSATYILGENIPKNLPVSFGGPISTYSISPPLTNLSMDLTNGVIFGRPFRTQAPTTYTVTASNPGGSVTTQITISIVTAALSVTSPASGTYIDTASGSTNYQTFALSGTCSPDGPASVVISGDATQKVDCTSGTWSAQLDFSSVLGHAYATVTVLHHYVKTVLSFLFAPSGGVAPSNLTYSTNPANYTLGSVITNNTPSSSGGAVTSYSITPALFTGLNFNTTTGVIFGNPTAVSAAVNYMVTATNANGSTTATVSIAVNDHAPTSLAYSTNSAIYTKGTQITNNVPSNSGGTVASYAISPALTAGLNFSTSTGVISGTPSTLTIAANYTVTATNTGGSTTATISITVNDAAPSGLAYSTNPASYPVTTPITNNTPTSSGGAVTSYSISPALPEGLNFNTGTGIVSGTPTAISAAAVYTITATNVTGSTTAAVTIGVTQAPPASLAYSANPAVYNINTPITNNSPSSSGGSITSYSVSPSLPAGLILNTGTGVISGTPTAGSFASPYIVTATGPGGSTSVSVSIEVVDAAPTNFAYATPTASFSFGYFAYDAPSISGGRVLAYSISGTLPEGLSLNTSNGVISGTPDILTSSTTYTVTATNSGGAVTTTVSIAVVQAAPAQLVYSYGAADLIVGLPITSNVPSYAGGVPDSYSISPALPSGVSLNTTTGIISGTPTATSLLTTYTVTATNTVGSATTALTMTASANNYTANGCNPASATISVGSGTSGTPYLICSAGQLAAVSNNLSAYYQLDNSVNTIDLLNDPTYTTGDWGPIGSVSAPFTGSFDGNGVVIDGLSITGGGGYLGLFGVSSGAIQNVALTNVNISPATAVDSTYVGALAGWNKAGGTISSSSSAGAVDARMNVGGLVGENDGSVTNSSSSASVTGDELSTGLAVSNIGGLIGESTGVTTGDSASGSVATAGTTTTHTNIGGLIGLVDYTASGTTTAVSSSSSSGTVSGNTVIEQNVGGLVGKSLMANFTGCSATGNVSGQSSVGGLIGYAAGDLANNATVTVSGSTANPPGSVVASLADGSGNSYAGGLVGRASLIVLTNCQSTGGTVTNVTATTGGQYIGGMIGSITGVINGTTPVYSSISGNSSSASSVVAMAPTPGTHLAAGGLAGFAYLTHMTSVSASGNVSGNGSAIGGIVGDIQGAPGNALAGNPHSTLSSCSFTGNVNSAAGTGGTVYSAAGGVAGYVLLTDITGCGATGLVIADGTPVDGLAGDFQGGGSASITGTTSSGTVINGIQPPLNLAYLTPQAVYAVGVSAYNSPRSTGGSIASYSISGALPSGLNFSTSTGIISGTPTALSAAANYTVTATNAGGTATATISIAVTNAAPTSLSYSNSIPNYTVGVAITNDTPTNSGGLVGSYSIDPALPAGLIFNTSTGVISGTPNAAASPATYVVTASNSVGSATVPLVVTVDIARITGNTSNGCNPASATITTGSGTSASPYLICSAGQVAYISQNLSAYYKLDNSLRAIDLANDNTFTASTWTPIGNTSTPFTGNLNGNGVIISNIKITGGGSYLGLFGASSGTINNVILAGVNIVPASAVDSTYVGGLVGWNETGGTVNASSSAGAVSGRTNVGGLVGKNDGTLTASASAAAVTGSELGTGLAVSNIGGLVGLSTGAMSGDSSSSMVSTSGSAATHTCIGGLIGLVDYSSSGITTPISSSSATGNVTGNTSVDQSVGGLIGKSVLANVQGCSASGNVSGKSSVGGLIGYASGDLVNNLTVTIGGSSANPTGTTVSSLSDGSGNSYAGGLIGQAALIIVDNSQSGGGTVTNTGSGSGGKFVGGLVGSITGVINGSTPVYSAINDGSSSSSSVVAAAPNAGASLGAGGLVGYAFLTHIDTVSATGDVTGNGSDVGGIVGDIEGAPNSAGAGYPHSSISNCSYFGTVSSLAGTSGNIYSAAGGIAGYALLTDISNCGASGVVTADGSSADGVVGDFQGGGLAYLSGITSVSTFIPGTSNNAPPFNLVYSAPTASYPIGVGISITSSNSGGDPLTYSISAALPTGLNFDTLTGIISGTPTALSGATVYVVTATNSFGSTHAAVSIAVVDSAPLGLGYPDNPASYVAGTLISNNVPFTAGGDPATSFSVNTALPAGLSLNTMTGIISGTPTAASSLAVYTVTASNATGSTTTLLSILVDGILSNGHTARGCVPTNATITVGDGSSGNPYVVCSAGQLASINSNLSASYLVDPGIGSIDLTNDSTWNHATWTPIGNQSTFFSGNFEGSGVTISHLNIVSGGSYLGLFGASTGSIRDVVLSLVNIVPGSPADSTYVGALVGWNTSAGSIWNCSSSGAIRGRMNVGGLVGVNDGALRGSASAMAVTGDELGTGLAVSNIGGLVGLTTGPMSDDSSSGAVSTAGAVTTHTNIGGLIGIADYSVSGVTAPIDGCTAAGNITGSGVAQQNVGGLIGKSLTVNLSNSSAGGSVSGQSSVGGLIGLALGDTVNFVTVAITGCSANPTGTTVSASADSSGNSYVGGLIGRGSLLVVDASQSGGGTVANSGGKFIGGLIGSLTGTINGITPIYSQIFHGSTSSSVIQALAPTPGSYLAAGGLVGYGYLVQADTVSAFGNVTGNGSDVGGIFGDFRGDPSNAGAGYPHSSLSNCSYLGLVSSVANTGGVPYSAVGGVAGYDLLGDITNCQSGGDVIADGAPSGALVGDFEGGGSAQIAGSDSFSTVIGVGPETPGGLIGLLNTGTVTGSTFAGSANYTTAVDLSSFVQITQFPPLITNLATATFSFAASNSTYSASYQCSLDAGTFAACTSLKTYSNLNQRTHTFAVQGLTAGGVPGQTANFSWVVDLTPPTVSLTTAPTGFSGSLVGEIDFTSSDTGGGRVAGTACSVDNGDYVPCDSNVTYGSLLGGQHCVNIRAADTAGNIGTPVQACFTLDFDFQVVMVGNPNGPGNPAAPAVPAGLGSGYKPQAPNDPIVGQVFNLWNLGNGSFADSVLAWGSVGAARPPSGSYDVLIIEKGLFYPRYLYSIETDARDADPLTPSMSDVNSIIQDINFKGSEDSPCTPTGVMVFMPHQDAPGGDFSDYMKIGDWSGFSDDDLTEVQLYLAGQEAVRCSLSPNVSSGELSKKDAPEFIPVTLVIDTPDGRWSFDQLFNLQGPPVFPKDPQSISLSACGAVDGLTLNGHNFGHCAKVLINGQDNKCVDAKGGSGDACTCTSISNGNPDNGQTTSQLTNIFDNFKQHALNTDGSEPDPNPSPAPSVTETDPNAFNRCPYAFICDVGCTWRTWETYPGVTTLVYTNDYGGFVSYGGGKCTDDTVFSLSYSQDDCIAQTGGGAGGGGPGGGGPGGGGGGFGGGGFSCPASPGGPFAIYGNTFSLNGHQEVTFPPYPRPNEGFTAQNPAPDPSPPPPDNPDSTPGCDSQQEKDLTAGTGNLSKFTSCSGWSEKDVLFRSFKFKWNPNNSCNIEIVAGSVNGGTEPYTCIECQAANKTVLGSD